METMHRKRNKYEIIFSFGFDLGRLGQNQLWKKRFISNFWGAGQNPTVFYCDHSKESLLKVLLAYFSGFLCFYPKIFGLSSIFFFTNFAESWGVETASNGYSAFTIDFAFACGQVKYQYTVDLRLAHDGDGYENVT